jgi:glycosyltransferase involved in cell wall biosynthesis
MSNPSKNKRNPRQVGGKLPPGEGRPSISLVMIAKDEEDNLPRALKSVYEWVDEIIVVDTGSSDRTMEIAREYGAKIYEHPWEHNFSLHRNQAIGYASCDWCLQLDADEEMDPKTIGNLPGILQSTRAMACKVEIHNLFSSGDISTFYYPRLYRNHPGIGYHRRVHNQLTHPGQAQTVDLRILHYGYDGDEAFLEKKFQRRVSMIRAWIEEQPEDWEARFYLAQALVAREETLAESVEQGLKALELLEKIPAEAKNKNLVYPRLCHALYRLESYAEMGRHLKAWEKIAPHNPDLWYFNTLHHYCHDRWREMLGTIDRYEHLMVQFEDDPDRFAELGEIFSSKGGFFMAALRVLALLALQENQLADQALKRVLARDDAARSAQVLVERLLSKSMYGFAYNTAVKVAQRHPDWEYFQSFIDSVTIKKAPPAKEDQASSLDPAQDKMMQGLVAKAQELSRQGRPPQAAMAYEEAFALFTPDARQLAELGFIYAGQGMYHRSEALYRKALSLEPELGGARFNLAMVLARQGKSEQAKQLAKQCVEMQPELHSAKQLFNQLSGLLAGPQPATQGPSGDLLWIEGLDSHPLQ